MIVEVRIESRRKGPCFNIARHILEVKRSQRTVRTRLQSNLNLSQGAMILFYSVLSLNNVRSETSQDGTRSTSPDMIFSLHVHSELR